MVRACRYCPDRPPHAAAWRVGLAGTMVYGYRVAYARYQKISPRRVHSATHLSRDRYLRGNHGWRTARLDAVRSIIAYWLGLASCRALKLGI